MHPRRSGVVNLAGENRSYQRFGPAAIRSTVKQFYVEENMRMLLVAVRCVALVLCMSLVFVACQDDNDEVADPIEGEVIGSPTAAAGLEEDIEEIALEIVDGALSEDGIELTQERPTVMTITNNDDVSYLFQIESLVTETPIPAGEMVSIEFTTPVSTEYAGELRPDGGGDPVDTVEVQVTDPTGAPD
jgi:hypothetical protein